MSKLKSLLTLTYRRVGEAGTHPTSTDHVSGPIQTASNGETVGKNQVNSLYIHPTRIKYILYTCSLYTVAAQIVRPRILG